MHDTYHVVESSDKPKLKFKSFLFFLIGIGGIIMTYIGIWLLDMFKHELFSSLFWWLSFVLSVAGIILCLNFITRPWNYRLSRVWMFILSFEDFFGMLATGLFLADQGMLGAVAIIPSFIIPLIISLSDYRNESIFEPY